MKRTNGQRKVALLCLVASVALIGACDADKSIDSSTPKPRTSQSSPSAVPDAEAAKAVLDQAFIGMEALGSGGGRLQPHIGNTLPTTPANVLSVTFAFTCTGKGKVAFAFTVNGRDAAKTAHTSICDGSIFQQSIEVSKPGLISFEGELTGSDNGSFAYSFYTEKKQLP
ncbi:hypothetical protein [Streptomyces sp. HD]|uniref:hypothetical protein n=1 Tax=Streptomyces sp. HD TaxID=3020892 RepID=UPI00232D72FC|nr:hypothetical protein [Streptomyces sp. HD]MDC0769911.1 hypothetical protein [Streptomyces sp. HD]